MKVKKITLEEINVIAQEILGENATEWDLEELEDCGYTHGKEALDFFRTVCEKQAAINARCASRR